MSKIRDLKLIFILFIFYNVIKQFSKKKIIEGVDSSSSSGVKCHDGGTDYNVDNVQCNYPFVSKETILTTNQCQNGTKTCTELEKKQNCCNSRTEICQGNLDPTKDITCDDGSWPKIDSGNIPYECDGRDTDSEDCWMFGKPKLSSMSNEEQQRLCCTDRGDFLLAEQFWGIPYLINKASKKYDDSKLLRSSGSIQQADNLLNEALEFLHEARKIDTSGRYTNIAELIRDWGTESGHSLGSGMCVGNIIASGDVNCSEINKEYVEKPFIKTGTTVASCCTYSGLCTGNTNSAEDVTCPNGTTAKANTRGTTVQECCERGRTCRGNLNINLNFDCPTPLIPVIDANTKLGSTTAECCRGPDDKHESELVYSSENELISATLIINGNLLQNAGLENSEKRKTFIQNFKEDIVHIINKGGKINVSTDQVVITKIYSGSIIVNFEINPDVVTNTSITKEYLSFLFSEKIYLPKLSLYTSGGVTNLSIFSWYNIDKWPPWIWYIIIFTLTLIITSVILL